MSLGDSRKLTSVPPALNPASNNNIPTTQYIPIYRSVHTLDSNNTVRTERTDCTEAAGSGQNGPSVVSRATKLRLPPMTSARVLSLAFYSLEFGTVSCSLANRTIDPIECACDPLSSLIVFEMSCNGCRVLRKGCSDSCILRPCLQWIEGAEAQGHATVFVAKFFGRAGLMNFISSVPDNQRPALFQSLLYEACGRTVNPVFGAVGLLWSGNWHLCQAAVETVFKGCSLQPMFSLGTPQSLTTNCRASPDSVLHDQLQGPQWNNKRVFTGNLSDCKKARKQGETVKREWSSSPNLVVPVPRRIRPRYQADEAIDLDLSLGHHYKKEKRVHSPCQSLTSEGSVTSVDTGEFKISLIRGS